MLHVGKNLFMHTVKNSLQAEMIEIAVIQQNLDRRYAQHLVLCVVDMVFFFFVQICDAEF